jgi:hypothetical protein
MADSTKAKRVGDFLLYDIPQVCREVVTIMNDDTSVAIALTEEELIGRPIKAESGGYSLVLDGEESEVVGFLISGPALSLAGSSSVSGKHVAITLGPCCINKDQIAEHDQFGDDLDADDLQTYALVLGMRCAVEPEETSTQDE